MIAASRRIAAFLLRAGLLTAAVGIIAGFFGMHFITGAHSMAHSGSVTGVGHASFGAHVSPSGAPAAGPVPGSSSSCSSAGSGPEMSVDSAGCVLSAQPRSLAAPMPGTAAPYALPNFGRALLPKLGNYSYSPDSPSPGDLCISRT